MSQQPIDLNIKFNGSYQFFRWILLKYKKELPYCGYVSHFALENNYCVSSSKDWKHYGVGYRVWNLLHKDLTIAFLMGKIPVANIYELQKMYEAWKKDDTKTFKDL